MISRFIKNNLKIIIVVGLTAIICISGTVFAAFQYNAKQVEYKDGKSVEEALNELYLSNKKYTEEQYQEYGNQKYNEGINVSANSFGFKTGVTTINKGNNEIQVGFVPKYITAILETSNGAAPANVNFFYNSELSTTNSFRYHRTSNTLYQETMEGESSSNNSIIHISAIINNGFMFFCSVDNYKLYWTAYK